MHNQSFLKRCSRNYKKHTQNQVSQLRGIDWIVHDWNVLHKGLSTATAALICIQNPAKQLRLNFLWEKVTVFSCQLFPQLHLKCVTGFWIHLCRNSESFGKFPRKHMWYSENILLKVNPTKGVFPKFPKFSENSLSRTPLDGCSKQLDGANNPDASSLFVRLFFTLSRLQFIVKTTQLPTLGILHDLVYFTTRVLDTSGTSATWVRQECDMNNTSATRLRHERKFLILITTRVKTFLFLKWVHNTTFFKFPSKKYTIDENYEDLSTRNLNI